MNKDGHRKSYSEKLRDPRWQKIRLQVFERDEWTCTYCGEGGQTLHVHHSYYENKMDPWEYPQESLITLCEDCHHSEYECRPVMERHLLQSLKMGKFSWADIESLIGPLEHMVTAIPRWAIIFLISDVLTKPELQKQLWEPHRQQMDHFQVSWAGPSFYKNFQEDYREAMKAKFGPDEMELFEKRRGALKSLLN